jgi:hypothetical protein
MTLRARMLRYGALLALGFGLFVLAYFECCWGNLVASYAAYAAAAVVIFATLAYSFVLERRFAPPGGYPTMKNRGLFMGLLLAAGAIDFASVLVRGAARYDLLIAAGVLGAGVLVAAALQAARTMRRAP